MIPTRIMTTLLVGYLATPSIATAAQGSAELMTAQESATLDLKAAGDVAPQLGFFARNRITNDYGRATTMFGLTDLAYTLLPDFALVAEVQFLPATQPVPRAGAQYTSQRGDWSIYVLLTAAIQTEFNLEAVTAVQYQPTLNNELKLLTEVENGTNVSDRKHNFSVQRLRAGLTLDKYQAGVASDILETGNEVDPNLGLFFRVRYF